MSLQTTSKFIRKLQRSPFAQNVAILATGSAIAKAIPLIALPLVSRLFDPGDFGVATLFLSISTIFGIILTLHYDRAIVLLKDPAAANRIMAIAVTSSLIIFFLLLGLVLITKAGHWEPEWAIQLGLWFYFLPLGALLIALDNTALGLATREKHFRRIAKASIIQASMVTGIRVITGFFNSGVTGLIGSALTAAIARLAYLWLPQKDHIRKHSCFDSPGKMLKLMYEYRHFPYYSLPADLLRSLNRNLPVFALAIIFGPIVVGLYAIGNRILLMPISLFTESVRRTYLQRATELLDHGESLKRLLFKVTGGLALAGLIIFPPVLLFGDIIFTFVLGKKWTGAGEYAQILSPFLFFIFIQGPSGATFVVLQKQHILLKLQVMTTLLITGTFFVSFTYSLEPKTTLAFFSAVASVMSIIVIAIAITLSYTRNSPAKNTFPS